MDVNWKSVSAAVAKVAPLLGTALGGPGGTAIGALVAGVLGCEATPDAVTAAIATDPNAAMKLKQAELDHDTQLKQLAFQQASNELAADTARIQAVNATMQAEAKSDHWPTFTWRPFIGFIFGITFFGVYFLLPVMGKPVPAVPYEAWVAIGGVLGVASWFRGKMQADPAIPTDNRG